ncbi:MAG: hypothetical protein HQL19_05655, partial [Candidatus Omnitrophica bacterium]|nr:hypothetical protein [Candidatus Omnitrophota bacterium]
LASELAAHLRIILLPVRDYIRLIGLLGRRSVQAQLEAPAFRMLPADEKLAEMTRILTRQNEESLSQTYMHQIYTALPRQISPSLKRADILKVNLTLKQFDHLRKSLERNKQLIVFIEKKLMQMPKRERLEGLTTWFHHKDHNTLLHRVLPSQLHSGLPQQLMTGVMRSDIPRIDHAMAASDWIRADQVVRFLESVKTERPDDYPAALSLARQFLGFNAPKGEMGILATLEQAGERSFNLEDYRAGPEGKQRSLPLDPSYAGIIDQMKAFVVHEMTAGDVQHGVFHIVTGADITAAGQMGIAYFLADKYYPHHLPGGMEDPSVRQKRMLFIIRNPRLQVGQWIFVPDVNLHIREARCTLIRGYDSVMMALYEMIYAAFPSSPSKEHFELDRKHVFRVVHELADARLTGQGIRPSRKDVIDMAGVFFAYDIATEEVKNLRHVLNEFYSGLEAENSAMVTPGLGRPIVAGQLSDFLSAIDPIRDPQKYNFLMRVARSVVQVTQPMEDWEVVALLKDQGRALSMDEVFDHFSGGKEISVEDRRKIVSEFLAFALQHVWSGATIKMRAAGPDIEHHIQEGVFHVVNNNETPDMIAQRYYANDRAKRDLFKAQHPTVVVDQWIFMPDVDPYMKEARRNTIDRYRRVVQALFEAQGSGASKDSQARIAVLFDIINDYADKYLSGTPYQAGFAGFMGSDMSGLNIPAAEVQRISQLLDEFYAEVTDDFQEDSAMVTANTTSGGIDMARALIPDIKIDHALPAQFVPLQRAAMHADILLGMRAVIISVKPVENLPELLNLRRP